MYKQFIKNRVGLIGVTDIREELALSQEIAGNVLARNSQFARGLDKQRPTSLAPLSPQQRDCLALAANGLTARESGEALRIKKVTVEKYRKIAMEKLHCKTLTQATCKAMYLGLIPFDACAQSAALGSLEVPS